MAAGEILAEVNLAERKTIKCDEVQHPPEGSFTSEALEWFPCLKKGQKNSYLEAWISMDRLNDFIRGESSRPMFQCSFKIRKTQVCKDKIVRSYWCTYGPMDERKVSVCNWASRQKEMKNSGRRRRGLGSRPARMTVDVGLSLRRGCRSHFNVIGSKSKEDCVLISWVEQRHVDLEGNICHGMLDEDSRVTNSQIAPKLSRDCVLFVERLLRSGVPLAEILAEHLQRIAGVVRREENVGSSNWTRDMQLSAADIRNIQTRLRKEGSVYHHDDATAVRQWTERFPDFVIHYKEQSREADTPFSLVFCTPWMLQALAEYGQRKAVCLDATHGTNRYGFQLFTWMVYDKHQNGIPVVWALLERHRAEDLQVVQEKIKETVEKRHADILGGEFQPSCFLCDDSAEEKASIRAVYPGCPVDLCIWHVRCTFNKNLTTKVHDAVHRAVLNKELGNMMYTSEADPTELVSRFINKWRHLESKFIEYFEQHWASKLKEWVLVYRTHERANQNTTGAVERWHHTLKSHIRASSFKKTQRTLCWLVVMLTEKIERDFWCSAELKLQGRTRNRIVEGQVVAVCVKARSIPDTAIQTVELGGVRVRVCESQKCPGVFYTVSDWGSANSKCTCQQSSLGNLCKHEVKALFMDGYSETEIVTAFGRKHGSTVRGLLQGQTMSVPHAEVEGDSDFHFPFACEEDTQKNIAEDKVTVDTIVSDIKYFDNKVGSDNFFMSHLRVRVKEVIKEVLTMKAKLETNTAVHGNLDRIIAPFEFVQDVGEAADLERKKSWHEKMHEGFKKRPRVQRRNSETTEECPVPLERAKKTPWVSFDKQFDGDALKQIIGGVNEVEKGKRRKRVVSTRPKIGSSTGNQKGKSQKSSALGSQNFTVEKENINLNVLPSIST